MSLGLHDPNTRAANHYGNVYPSVNVKIKQK